MDTTGKSWISEFGVKSFEETEYTNRNEICMPVNKVSDIRIGYNGDETYLCLNVDESVTRDLTQVQ